MIKVTKLNKAVLVVNADMIEFVESTPDTLITLTTGRKVMVRETLDELLMRVQEYRVATSSHPVPVTANVSGAREPKRGGRQRRSD